MKPLEFVWCFTIVSSCMLGVMMAPGMAGYMAWDELHKRGRRK